MKHRILHVVRGIHIWLGLVVALYLTLIAITGVALNHTHAFRLNDRYVSRAWLPSMYHAEESQVRADVVVSDLHSGLLLGRAGAPMLDTVAIFCLALIASGVTTFALGGSVFSERVATIEQSSKETEVQLPRPQRAPFLVVSSKATGRAKVLSFKNNR